MSTVSPSEQNKAAVAMMNMREAINDALRLKMAEDDRIYLVGEDIGKMGGFFRVTADLEAQFGEDRVIDTPLNETAIVGAAIGMAMFGLRPVVEIQQMDFVYPAADQIINELAKLRFRSGGQFNAPVVVRAPCGGGIGGGLYHSQSVEAMFLHVAGLKVVMPSNPSDAKGLLISALEAEDPVMFLEPKRLYDGAQKEVPVPSYRVPLGSAGVVRRGVDLTLVTYGSMVDVAVEASSRLASEHRVDCEVIDLRTLNPWDEALVMDSVSSTRRAVVLHEAQMTCGFGAEVASRITEELFHELRSPVMRIAGYDIPYPYALEHLYPPNPERVCRRILSMLEERAAEASAPERADG